MLAPVYDGEALKRLPIQSMLASLPDRSVPLLRAALVAALATFAVTYVVRSMHWPLAVDSPIMHYVVFLMRHGLRPYVDITDNNMPGAYLTESWAMTIFGASDLAWRLYEFSLLSLMTLALVAISWPYDWLAGVYAGGLFLLTHAVEGPDYAAEREEVMTALLLLGYAALFAGVRRRQPLLLLPFGLATALAASIKPTFAPLALLLLALAWSHLRRQETGLGLRPYVLWTIAGFALVSAAILIFLLQQHAFSGFLFTLRAITPSYVGLNRPNYVRLAAKIFPKSFVPLLLLAGILLLRYRGWTWEHWALVLGAAVGALSYLVQGKDYPHHRYTFVVFLLLLCCLELTAALRRPGWPRLLAAAALVYTVGVSVPRSLHILSEVVDHSDFALALEQDLRALGSDRPQLMLQDKVQCFDLVFGCFNALYHLDVVENSAFTGDLLLFSPSDSAAVRFYRNLFWARAIKDPADVLVVSNEWFFGHATYDKLNTWPEFREYLARDYVEVLARDFPFEDRHTPSNSPEDPPHAYRIYLRVQSPLRRRAQQLGWRP